ncbi:MAG: cation:proton antiporter [Anaerolineae bacterium]|nr:cation:proton antiporter [Anaerolineae bacterium]
MAQPIVVGLAIILGLGIIAQWLAWRFKIPSILLLLLFGFLAGPVFGLIHPNEMFGELLFPFVSLSVAIILFEGGLSLKWGETEEVRGVLRLLISVGAFVTWVLASLAAYFILDMEALLAILLGAVLVVTGPTVVIPLLRQIRPSRRVGSILKWEGILIDPIGATLAVLVVEAILGGGAQPTLNFFHIAQGIVVTLLVGTAVGLVAGWLLVEFLRRDWIAPFLETAVALMMVLAAFALSNEFAAESGLMAATIMGIVLANQKKADVRHITAFKEELGVLLLSVLFIVLAARVNLSAISGILLPEMAFLAVLILVVRPLAVWVSAIGSKLSNREKLFVAALAPRGIVAVAVASLFALELEEVGFAGADQLVNITFLVVVGTVVVYSLTASPLARRLGLVQEHPQGVLIVGAHNWARQMALTLQEAGFEVWLVDANGGRVEIAHHLGLTAIHDSILSDAILDELPLERIGRILALTANSELNTLACLRFGEWLGDDHVYQLMPVRDDAPEQVDENLLGWLLFGPEVSYNLLDRLYYNGARAVCQPITEAADIFYEPAAILLFVITAEHRLRLPTITHPITPRTGETAVYLMPPEA